MANQISPLPTPPQRNDPANFAARGDAFLAALPNFQAQANALATGAEDDADRAEQAEQGAVTARDQANGHALAAENSASQAAADRVQTGLDRLATAADRQAVEQAIVAGPVLSVNGKSGVVTLDAEGVGALPDSGEIPRYDLASAATTTTLDLAASNIFRVNASSPRTLVFANAPAAGRAMGVLVKINGSSEITWPSGIEWDEGTAPQLGATWTDVGLINDGSVWTGSVRASA